MVQLNNEFEEKDAYCSGCGAKSPLDILRIEGTPNGYSVMGEGYCHNCGQFLQMSEDIDVELKELKCPSCKENSFDITYNSIDRMEGGFRFYALMRCKNQKCNWKKTLTSGYNAVRGFFNRLKNF